MMNLFFGFSGRITRKDYIIGLLCSQLAVVVIAFGIIDLSSIDFLIPDPVEPNSYVLGSTASKISTIAISLMYWINTALFFKRMHDISDVKRNKHKFIKLGYFIFTIIYFLLDILSLLALGKLSYSPIRFGLLISLFIAPAATLTPERGPNRFGPDPRNSEASKLDGSATSHFYRNSADTEFQSATAKHKAACAFGSRTPETANKAVNRHAGFGKRNNSIS